MIFLVDGVNNTGKTTFISAKNGVNSIHFGRPDWKNELGKYRFYFWGYIFLLFSKNDSYADRSHISELVYGKLYRNTQNRVFRAFFNTLLKIFKKRITFILAVENMEVLIKRGKNDENNTMNKNQLEKLHQEIKLFELEFARLSDMGFRVEFKNLGG